MDNLKFQKFAFSLIVAIIVGSIFGYFFYDSYVDFNAASPAEFHQDRFNLTILWTLVVSAVTFFGLRFITR
ncbi:hypothetical protein B9Q17_05900 [Marinobacter vinifirmus]|uniref:Uncharacterized protein n=1 Tax=Marinobacter vinifirmus TaxID=355591 RepID=A0A7Z1DTC2_9GAMM|nr:hypothetical protein [Marinobacter vinifirmus]OZC34547.1 hypothetical protein B9Q17_05900 [Marinobacter vinifirmus]